MPARGESGGSRPHRATGSAPSAEDIERFLAWRVVRAGRAVERVLTATIAEHDLTATQFGVLALLATGEDLSQSDLARAVLVRPQSVGPLITSLLERGLIRRRGPGGRGRRASFDLTPAGRRLIERAWPAVTRQHDASSLGLDGRDARALGPLLDTLEGAVADIEA